ncbi:MAG: SMC family ATPase [Dialister invisus]|uniref:Nuclease SbcCD subunit C n=2 Tax=Dialister invisus TaxID=218538 RepID=A0A930FRF3_9FIRM|nr:SMC family ATPase [Dialister invisus]
MRPERLRISAFGPYAGEEDMDFSVLENHTLFLICGPTGAGKSTILDAMCYALYGKTSGAVRSGEDLRSNYVGYDRKTYVEFDFAIGDRHYRIYRSPTQLLERQKGDRSKPVEHKGKADFYEIDEEGREKAHITSKGVDSAVEKLLGVGLEQFRQIILLPQGDFRKLLLADSSDRQKIMEQLFQTGIYLAFEKRLQEETQKLKTEYSRGELQRTTLLETCRSESEEELEKQAETNEKILKEKETEFMQADKEQQVFLRAYDEANVLHGAFLRLETAETALKRMEEKKKEKEELRGHIKMIRAAQSVTKEWSEAVNAKKQQRTAAETLEKAAADLPVKEKAKAEAEQALALFEKEKPKQKERIEMKGKLEQYRNPSRSYGTAKREAERLAGIYAVKQKEAERLRKQVSAAEKKAAEDKKNWLCRNRIFMEGQAFVLAEKLTDGQPCPVCGSLSHPAPAVAGEDRITEKDVKDAERQMHLSEDAEKKIRHEAEAYQAKELAAAKESADKAMTVLSELEKNLPAAYRDSLALEKEIKDLETRISSFEKSLEQAEEKRKNAETIYQALKKQKELLEKQAGEFLKVSEEKNCILKIKVAEAGFTDWFECSRYMKEVPRLEAYENDLKIYDQSVHAEEEKIKGEKEKTAGKTKPDMNDWNEKRTKLLESMKQFVAEKAEKETELKKQKETLKKLYQLKETQKEISEKYSLVAHLWEIAQGKETGINLERFVLGALLDAVTEKANLRLMEMSGNRYELLRKRGERSDGRKKAGLDLEVFDGNTGRARPAATLSGGETFLASLSLALGLADVVQEYAGGVHLDAMFIDEGFGSLDSESLDLAMKTLQELKGQNRLIGLISHVGGLEERIPAKLRVTKTQTGSTAAFEMG